MRFLSSPTASNRVSLVKATKTWGIQNLPQHHIGNKLHYRVASDLVPWVLPHCSQEFLFSETMGAYCTMIPGLFCGNFSAISPLEHVADFVKIYPISTCNSVLLSMHSVPVGLMEKTVRTQKNDIKFVDRTLENHFVT